MTKADTEITFLGIVCHIENVSDNSQNNMVTGGQEYGPKVIGFFSLYNL